jgi:hypothetical protein
MTQYGPENIVPVFDIEGKTKLAPISYLMGLLCYPKAAIEAPLPLQSLLSRKQVMLCADRINNLILICKYLWWFNLFFTESGCS